MFSEKRFLETPHQVDRILALTSPRGKSVLDLCCGPGRCSIALAKQGFSVCGVDRTTYLLEKARKRAKSERVSVEWIQADMRNFVRPNRYDLALNVFTSFGYFSDRRQDVAVLENVFKSLRRGGVFFMDMMGKEVLARTFQPASADSLPDGAMIVEQREIVDDWRRIRTTWTIIRNGAARQYSFSLNLYSGQELRESLEHVGFVEVKLYGSLDGDPYGVAARRLIAVARK